MRRYIFSAVVVLLTLVPGARAQEYSDEHLQAAEELLSQIDMQTVLAQSIDGMLVAQVQQNPALAPYEDVMRSFLQKYMGWHNLKDSFARLYAEAFTEEELHEVTAFYRTETGRKVARVTPMLMSKGMALGQQIVAENTPELERMLQERMEELSGDG